MYTSQASITVRERLCIEVKPAPCGMVVFGASGDLAHRKILPSLLQLFAKNLLSEHFYVIGCGRTTYSDQAFKKIVREAILAQAPDVTHDIASAFLDRCYYLSGSYTDTSLYESLGRTMSELDTKYSTEKNHLYYLSIPPMLYAPVVQHLADAGQVQEHSCSNGWARVIVEKPHGHDLDSAKALSQQLRAVLSEDQIYRIDHYLGKDTVQNIMMFRFANIMFEPVWNQQYIDHVQIAVTESLGIGSRAGYFEQAGLLRDMFQNHMMQLLSLVAMEPPHTFSADHIRDEKMKLLRAVRPFPLDNLPAWIMRGQYSAGRIADRPVAGYREEQNVAGDSRTETYIAAKLMIDNWRWKGVPFYLRSGKRLMCKNSEIAVYFKHVPHSMFTPLNPEDLSPNVLIFTIQPDEGLVLRIQAKSPGPKLCISDMNLDVTYADVFKSAPPDAYERLLLDCMLGDQTLFVRDDIVELTWKLWTPVLNAWAGDPALPLYEYPAGSWGPAEADQLVQSDNRQWRDLCLWCRRKE